MEGRCIVGCIQLGTKSMYCIVAGVIRGTPLYLYACFVVLNVAPSEFYAGNNQLYGFAIGFAVVADGYGSYHISEGCFNLAVAIGIDIFPCSFGAVRARRFLSHAYLLQQFHSDEYLQYLGIAVDLPRTGDELTNIVNVLLNTAEESVTQTSMAGLIRQAVVRCDVVLELIQGAKRRGHLAYRNVGDANAFKSCITSCQ